MESHVPEPLDRATDFSRMRWLQCPSCQHSWSAGWDFIEEWDECQTGCPLCGILADDVLVERPPYVSAPDEQMADDAMVRKSSWFHTSFHADWPRANYDPFDDYGSVATSRHREVLGDYHDTWLSRQKNKALHVGTYESAVANLYRRLSDQPCDHDLDFHIYRLQLTDDAAIKPGIFSELSNFVGDADLDEVCPWPNEVRRYVNIHEDEGSISLAVRRSAINRVQSVKILDLPVDSAELERITRRVTEADALPPPPPRRDLLGYRTIQDSYRKIECNRVVTRLSASIPWRLRENFCRGTIGKSDETVAPETWARWVLGIRELALNPSGVLEALKAEPWVGVQH